MFVKDMNKKEVINFLEKVRTGCLCAYIGGGFCDCKYGADKIGGMDEKGNGCPEMRNIILFFEEMTEEQFNDVSKLVWKK